MSRMHDDLDVTVRVLKRLSVHAPPFRSWNQLAKRERLTDDKLTRSLARSADLVGGDLTEVRDNRIVPTELGLAFRDLVEPLLALGRRQAESVEVVRVAVGPGIDPGLLAPALAEFGRQWEGIVTAEVTLAADEMRDAIDSHGAAFGIAWADGEAGEADQRVEPDVPLSALVPNGHRLGAAGGPLDGEHFSAADRVFVSPRVAAAVGEVLARVSPVNRVVVGCPGTLHLLVGAGAGVGFEYAHPGRRAGELFTRLPVAGVEPVAIGVWLSRRLDRMTDPANSLLGVLRRVVRDAAGPPLTPPVALLAELSSAPEPLPA